jgi:hypothetical protein
MEIRLLHLTQMRDQLIQVMLFIPSRDFMPHFTTNFSPFTVRIRPGRRREETSSKGGTMKNPSLTGQSSTSSATSSARCVMPAV